MGHKIINLNKRNTKSFMALALLSGVMALYNNCGRQGGFETSSFSNQEESSDATSLEAPLITINSSPEDSSLQGTTLNVTFRVSGGAPIQSLTCQLDFSPAIDCSSLSAHFNGLTDGDHLLTIKAVTTTGKSSQKQAVYRKDNTAPTISVSVTPSSISPLTTATFQFSVADNLSGLEILECSLDTANFSVCTSPSNLSNLSNGNHTYRIRSKDKAGNVSKVYSYSWNINPSSPAAPALTTKPAAFTNMQTASFSFTGSSSVYECQMDGGAFVTCSSPQSYTSLSAGAHTFGVRGKDAQGTTTGLSNYAWTIDRTSPSVPLIMSNVSSVTQQTSATFNFSATDASGISGYQCSLDDAAFVACTSPVKFSGLSVAAHAFRVQASDQATNTSLSTFNWIVEMALPPPPPPPGSKALAFTGAEGFGTETRGGRGGKVYVVDTLSWRGPGSLGDALLAKEPRIIVFRVSGVINVNQGVELTEANSYVTVAGQTSPGGITLTGSPGDFISSYKTNFHDAVFRFIRFRGRGSYDNISLNTVHHIVFDHCDFSGGSDEAFDMTFASDVTVQWSTITNSDSSGQNYGALLAYAPTSRISWHHNFMANHKGRCLPEFHWGSSPNPPDNTQIDVRNNVLYNCGFAAGMWVNDPGSGASRITFNLVNNYIKAGPNTPSNAYDYYMGSSGVRTYESGTIYEGGTHRNVSRLTAAGEMPTVTTYPTSQAYDLVLQKAGAFPRDTMNTRTVNEAETKTGRLGKLDDTLLINAPPPPMDTDRDGMPDTWETARGLNSNNPGDATQDRNSDGYTNIEEYINELADSLVP